MIKTIQDKIIKNFEQIFYTIGLFFAILFLIL